MTNLEKITTILAKRKITLEQLAGYTRHKPELKKRVHAAVVEIYYQGNVSVSEMLRVLPQGYGFSRHQLVAAKNGHAKELRSTFYTTDETETIKELLKTKTYAEIAKELGRTADAIECKAKRLKANYKIERPDYWKYLHGKNFKSAERAAAKAG